MLGTKGILMGANSQSPALNDFAKLVATRIDDNFSCREVATTVMETSFALKGGRLTLGDEYAALRAYIADGGNMCQLAAQISTIIAEKADPGYAERYAAESKLYFGV